MKFGEKIPVAFSEFLSPHYSMNFHHHREKTIHCNQPLMRKMSLLIDKVISLRQILGWVS